MCAGRDVRNMTHKIDSVQRERERREEKLNFGNSKSIEKLHNQTVRHRLSPTLEKTKANISSSKDLKG